MRIAVGLEYDGRDFCGWQHQDHSPSVQAAVEKALSKVANEAVKVVCAGRTDTGVHAKEQVVHFDTQSVRSEHSWLMGCNANLPKSVTVLWVKPVTDDFHARYSAISRSYRYVILNRNSRPAYLRNLVTWDYRQLDTQRMHLAGQYLLGEHDFSSYRAVACQSKTPVRTVTQLDVKRQGQIIVIDISANAFLHHMVRNVAGVLMAIGAGEQDILWSRHVLEFRDRTLGGVTAPPDGLYLSRVQYPTKFAIPEIDLEGVFPFSGI